MASEYPYAHVISKVPQLFDRVAKAGTPPKVDNKWLSQVGFPTNNDGRLKTILRHVGFIDSSGVPTQMWREYRGSNGRAVLATGIRNGYADLFHTFPNANRASNNEIEGFVRSSTTLGPEAVSKAVATFKALVALADFQQAIDSQSTPGEPDQKPSWQGMDEFEEKRTQLNGRNQSGITINVNLQLTLPESREPDVYDALFAALAKHILPERRDAA